MPRPPFAIPAAVIALSLAPPPAAAADALLLYNATVHPVAAPPVVGGGLLVEGGKVKAVVGRDEAAKLVRDGGVAARDLGGAVVVPGLVDSHSHVGVAGKPGVSAHSDTNEMSGPVQSGVRAVDSLWPDDPGVRMAVAGGVTVANVMPGSGNVIGGQTVYVKFRGRTVEEMRVTGRLADGREVLGGLKMANGENPKGYGRSKQQAPFTRMKVAALQREQFVKAREYAAKRKADANAPADLSLDPLVEVLDGRRTVHFHCHRADDIATAVRLADEFGFELVLQHATEGYRIADLLARKKVSASLTLLDSPGGKAETMGLLEENAAVLEKAGVPVAVNTDDWITESRFFLRTGAIAVRGGMSEASALRALTLAPAKMLHLDHRIGSLEPGKDADFVVLSGPPFSVYTKVRETWIDGKRAFDAANPDDRPYRDGGWAMPRGTPVPDGVEARPLPPAPGPNAAPDPDDSRVPGLFYIRAGRVHTVSGEPILDGAIVVRGGKIEAVGPAARLKRPPKATTLTAHEVTPGLIDPLTCAGLTGAWNIPADQDQDEPSDPNQADLRAFDGFNPHEPLLEVLRANGVTVAHVSSGRVNVVGARTGVFRLAGGTAEEAALVPSFAVLVNLGETPKDAFKGKGPGTRMAVAAVVRKAFAEAKEKAGGGKAKAAAAGGMATKPDASLAPKVAALIPAVEGRAPVIFAAHRADDVRTALRLADEFGLKAWVALGTEADFLADELARRQVPVLVHPTMQRAGASMETINTRLATAAALAAKGVPVAVCTSYEGYVPKTRNLRAEAAMAAANGLGHAAALRAVTLTPAKLLGIDRDYGSVEPGKAADLVLYDGDPFEHATHVTHTLIGGRVVYDRADYLRLPFERRMLPLLGGGPGAGCCAEW